MHGFGDNVAGQICLADLGPLQMNWDDTKGFTASLLCRTRHFTHQPNIARTINQPHIVPRQ